MGSNLLHQSLGHPFRPAWWCRGPHLQTLWASLLRRRPNVRFKRERLELPDGDFIDLDWTPNANGPIVVILHGLEGSSKSGYARGMLNAIQERGWRGVVMHFRGCSGEPNRLARGYHSGETSDPAYVFRLLRERESHTPLAAVGYSLGGNVLLKYLGESGRDTPLTAAVAVSVPYLLDRCANRIAHGFSRVYQWSLMRRMRDSVARKLTHMSLPFGGATLAGLHTFWDFDEHVTAPLHGFAGAVDYYRRSSSRRHLKDIAIPTLLLHALDDPFMTPDVVPDVSELSDRIELELYEHGGHVGFVSGSVPWQARYWLEERIPIYLERFMVGDAR